MPWMTSMSFIAWRTRFSMTRLTARGITPISRSCPRCPGGLAAPADRHLDVLRAAAAAPPAQGWKIHVSSCLDDAERVLDAVWDYCVPRGLAFKFLRSRPVMVMLNSKSAFRGSSGKLVTIYPMDEAQLELTLKELDAICPDVQGPYILSDLRYGGGPLFVRYGGFAERHCLSDSGERVLALEDGDGTARPRRAGAHLRACRPG